MGRPVLPIRHCERTGADSQQCLRTCLERFNPVSRAGELISMIDDLDHVLSTNKAFSLSSWLDAARVGERYCNAVCNSTVLSAQLPRRTWGLKQLISTSMVLEIKSRYGPNGEIFN